MSAELLEDLVPSFSWTVNSSHLCYTSEDADWCGYKGDCSQKGLVLPLFFEETWAKEFRAFIYFFALLYRLAAIFSPHTHHVSFTGIVRKKETEFVIFTTRTHSLGRLKSRFFLCTQGVHNCTQLRNWKLDLGCF